MNITERHLSRRVIEVLPSSTVYHALSVVEVCCGDKGDIISANVYPFRSEEWGITYHDKPLIVDKSSSKITLRELVEP